MREQWNSRTGFVLAAVGSAVGLGNIWRFPYMAYENGGGAFLIPYFFAMLTAGVPFLIMEFALGHRYKSAAPLSPSTPSSRAGSSWAGGRSWSAWSSPSTT
ncbi:MAG: hypothetical protein KMY53_02825 [Desulfarculus sp.]|nr:hypothetical protein [Desulfarculus sp.]MBV1753555.1 hypothetical protein [Desulfarculus sp.]